MSGVATLYVGMAAPLVEAAQQWEVPLPDFADAQERAEKLRQFPREAIGAYALSPDDAALTFRTGAAVPPERVRQNVEPWVGSAPKRLPSTVFRPLDDLDCRKVLAALRQALNGAPVQIVPRFGLTRQLLQQDLTGLKPELVLLNCHGTDDGYLVLEDGRGRADFLPGDGLFRILKPQPQVLFLAACHSERVLRHAGDAAGSGDIAVVHVLGEAPIEVAAYAAFSAMFFPALLRGEAAGEAFEAAREHVANDATVGNLTTAAGQKPASDKLRLNKAGRNVRLALTARNGTSKEAPAPPHVHAIRRTSDRFVGRRREMHKVIDALLPLPPGIHRGLGAGQRRLVTLTKEGGIGKTALGSQIVDWAVERDLFTGGVFELSCESLADGRVFVSNLLAALGVPAEAQQGDLLGLLRAVVAKCGKAGAVLLFLDSMDDLVGNHVAHAVRQQVLPALEAALDAQSDLRVLATCRWPLDLMNHETTLEVGPLAEDEARDVFLSHLDSSAHRREAQWTWPQLDSPIRQLVLMSGRHPQSLQLLARQMSRPGMTLTALRDEARADLMKVLKDPSAPADEQDRLRQVQVSYELSYRHLSDQGKQLFQRLSRLPGGVWCGQGADELLPWEQLLEDDWRETMDRELVYFALLHFEPDDPGGNLGAYQALRPMQEFARTKYDAASNPVWERQWVGFWRERLQVWNQMVSGRIPDGAAATDDQRAAYSAGTQNWAESLLRRTQPNWLAFFEYAAATEAALATRLLPELVPFLQLSGQHALRWWLTEAAVRANRKGGTDDDLASCLNMLGIVQSDLGEREAARESCTEALASYRRLAEAHPAAFEQYVATTLNNLGNVQRDLGEREAARESYTEALALYLPLAAKWPAAFAQYLRIVFRNYTTVTDESADDPWWQLWRQRSAGTEPGSGQ